MAGPERGVSLAGPLCMKVIGGALGIVRFKKKFFFALDEINNNIFYFKDENEFVKKKEPIGGIPLIDAVFTLSETNSNIFTIHTPEKIFEMEALNEQSCECWLSALSRRRGIPGTSDAILAWQSLGKARRQRSHSLPSETDLVNKRSGGLHIAPSRKRSCMQTNDQTSEGSTFALSVLEEKLKKIGFACSHQKWMLSASEEGSETTTAEEPQSFSPPIWLDEWVHKWLQQQQPFLPQHSTEQHQDSASHSLPSTESVDNSLYNSNDCASMASDAEEQNELHKLRAIDNRQKYRIQQLTSERKALFDQIEDLKKRTAELSPEGRLMLQNQNKFLNGEVLRLNKKCTDLELKLNNAASHLTEIQEELNKYKREYVFCLQSCIRIPLHDNNSLDIVQVKLYGGDVHKKRINQLLMYAREEDPGLPTLQSLQTGTYVDAFGFRHIYEDEALAVHYAAAQLNIHYNNHMDSAVEHKNKWKNFLENNPTIPLNRESKQLVRAGIPNGLRSPVWKILINQQVIDLKIAYGKYYYRNLCSSPGDEAQKQFFAQHQKQINLDLLRTMPNNVHFMSANCKGVAQLQQVLRAFCLHNGSLGYCQGMNFLAATALLFVGPEDAFWFLIALTEKFFDKTYFDDSLAGAQADQEVLKELLESKFPRIQHHLDSCEIELATITLNWFIALFFDAVPFQTLLRIWDCFLLEGPKVLFRFSVALLGLNECEILQKNDTIGIMKIVKATVKLTYDIEGFFILAFNDLNPFLSRSELKAKQKVYLALLQEKFSCRQQRRDLLTSSVSSCDSAYASSTMEPNDVPISDLAMSFEDEGFGFVVAGNQHIGCIGKLVLDNAINRINRLDIEFDCRVASLVIVNREMAFASLISGYILALHFEGNECSILWELKLSDVALKLLHDENRIIAALANGTITILENVIEKAPTSLELLHVPVGAAPIGEAAICGDNLWLAVACKIVVMNKSSLSHVATVYVACSASGSSTPFFEKILSMCISPHGAFVVTANSTLIQLWNANAVCGLLFDVAYDHSYRKPSLDDATAEEQGVHISALCFLDNLLWVGTNDGYVIMYHVDSSSADTKFRVHKYPSGRRILPKISPDGIKNVRPALCYIPTKEETRIDEAAEKINSPQRIPRRVSVKIDKDTHKYEVMVKKLRSASFNQKDLLKRQPRITNFRQTLTKECSHDSAVSVFSNGDGDAQKKAEVEQQKVEKEKMMRILRASTGSSSISMDYDDQFELYSEEGFNRNGRRLSVPSTHLQNVDMDLADTPTNALHLKLRRRDLNFDDPLIVAVQESDNHESSTENFCETINGDHGDAVISSVSLMLVMKLKISDQPVRRMVPTKHTGRDIMITCSGNYGDEEAMLKWYKDPESNLWINDPIVDAHANRRYSVFSSTPSSPSNIISTHK